RVRGWGAQILYKALVQTLRWNDPVGWHLVSRALAFISCEEKQTVTLVEVANRPAKRIANNVLRNVGLPLYQLRLLIKPVVRYVESWAVIFVNRAVKKVCPALGY